MSPRHLSILAGAGITALSACTGIAIHTARPGVATAFLFVQWLVIEAILQQCGKVAANAKSSISEAEKSQKAHRGQMLRAHATGQAVIDSLPHGIAIFSPAGQVELVNSRGVWLGLHRGKSVEELPQEWLKPLIAQAVKTRRPVGPFSNSHAPKATDGKGEKPMRLPGEALVQVFEEGRELFFMPQATPLMDAGELLGVTVVLVDVTASRQVEEAKSNLLSSFSHELKTPMTSIQMSIYLLLEDAAPRLTARELELLAAARDDADRLHRIVEEMLTSGRPR